MNEETFTLTSTHLTLMRHALGSGDRNFYGTTTDASDYQQWNELVNAGLAQKRAAPSWAIDDWIFYVTDEGIARINQRAT